MFRLTRAGRDGRIYLSLEGELTSDCVEAAESACLEAMGDGAQVKLLLRNVTEIDDAGIGLLRRLLEAGMQIRATGIYLRYVLRSLRAGS